MHSEKMAFSSSMLLALVYTTEDLTTVCSAIYTGKEQLYKLMRAGYFSRMTSHFSNLIQQLKLESGQSKHCQSILTHVKCIRKQKDRIAGLSSTS